MARKAEQIIQKKHTVKETPLRIPVAISARHVHLTQESIDTLFGKGYQLTEYKPLSQPGQFAANERVSLVGPKNTIERVRILGPVRSKNQVEISRTDEFFLGIDAPVRASGHVENTPGIKLVGPAGELSLTEGVICAWRHIHMTPADAETFGVVDKDIVEIRVENAERSLTFGNVLIRVSPKYALEMHIDTDEANAAELSRGAVGELIHTSHQGQMLRRKTS
ncbi:MAG: phosphate propanoyltransferase [Bacteroidota bacterium]